MVVQYSESLDFVLERYFIKAGLFAGQLRGKFVKMGVKCSSLSEVARGRCMDFQGFVELAYFRLRSKHYKALPKKNCKRIHSDQKLSF